MNEQDTRLIVCTAEMLRHCVTVYMGGCVFLLVRTGVHCLSHLNFQFKFSGDGTISSTMYLSEFIVSEKKMVPITVILRLTKIIRSGITLVGRKSSLAET